MKDKKVKINNLNLNYLIFSIFLVMIFFSGMFIFGCTYNNENNTYAEFIDSISKQYNLTAYNITYDVNDDGLEYNLNIIKYESDWRVGYEYPFAKIAFYSINSTPYACAEREGKRYCSDISSANFSDKGYHLAESQIVFGKDIDYTIKLYDTLNNHSALSIKQVDSGNIINRPVNCFELELDYSKLSTNELNKLGIPPTSNLVMLYKNITQKLCYDNETGILLSTNFSYMYNGHMFDISKKATSFSTQPFQNSIKIDKELEHYNVLKPVYNDITNDWVTYYRCSFENDTDTCLRDKSFENKNSKFCKLIKDTHKRNSCYTRAISYDNNPSLCENIEDSQNDRDSCYYLYVYYFGNKSYCKEIINDTIRNDCENLEITPAQPHKSECSVDADCGVKGKFGEFCVPINKTITIDEKKPWKKIYGCYNKTTCGCIDGECRWTPTDDFVDCIDTVENEEILKILNTKHNNQTNVTANQSTNQTSG